MFHKKSEILKFRKKNEIFAKYWNFGKKSKFSPNIENLNTNFEKCLLTFSIYLSKAEFYFAPYMRTPHKKSKFSPNIEILTKNRYFRQILKFWQKIEILTNNEILTKNRNFAKKSKFRQKIDIFAKYWYFGQNINYFKLCLSSFVVNFTFWSFLVSRKFWTETFKWLRGRFLRANWNHALKLGKFSFDRRGRFFWIFD